MDTPKENLQSRGRQSRLSPLSHCGETLCLNSGIGAREPRSIASTLRRGREKSSTALEKRRKGQVLVGTRRLRKEA